MVGVPEALREEAIVAFVVGDPMPEAALLKQCRRRLADSKVPQAVFRLGELPPRRGRQGRPQAAAAGGGSAHAGPRARAVTAPERGPLSFDLSGKVALVTGGSYGLGQAIVLGLARCGADVVIASRKLDACERTAEEVRRLTGREALPIACRMGDWKQIEALVERAYARLGRVAILVNNAGMSPLYPRLDGVTEELRDKVAAVNLKGPFRLSALVGTRIAAGSGGSIVNISSNAAIRPNPTELPYAAAKAGLNKLTAGLARPLHHRCGSTA